MSCSQMLELPLNVLVIEDNPDYLYLLTRCLKNTLDQISIYSHDALQSIPDDLEPDLVVSDLNLVDAKADEVLNFLKRFTSRTQVLIVSGDSVQIDVIKKQKVGDFMVLEKNTNLLTVLPQVLRLLQHNHKNRFYF
jgi:DNA-binding NtrC family response regulator